MIATKGKNHSWLVVWNHGILWVCIFWECHHPNWRTHILQRGRYTTNQIAYFCYLYIYPSYPPCTWCVLCNPDPGWPTMVPHGTHATPKPQWLIGFLCGSRGFQAMVFLIGISNRSYEIILTHVYSIRKFLIEYYDNHDIWWCMLILMLLIDM